MTGAVPARGRCGTAAGRRTGLFAGAIDRDHDISERSETAIIVRTNRFTTAGDGPGAGTGPVRHAAGRRTGLFAGAIDRDHDISEHSETAIIVRTNRSTTAVDGYGAGTGPVRHRVRGGALGCLLAPLTAIMTFLNALKQPS